MRGSRVGKSKPFQTFDYPPCLSVRRFADLDHHRRVSNTEDTKMNRRACIQAFKLVRSWKPCCHHSWRLVASNCAVYDLVAKWKPKIALAFTDDARRTLNHTDLHRFTNGLATAPLVASGCRGIPCSLCGCWSHPRTMQDRHGAVSCGRLQGCYPQGICLCRECRSLGRCTRLGPRYVCASASSVRFRTKRATLSLGHAALALPSHPLSLCLSEA